MELALPMAKVLTSALGWEMDLELALPMAKVLTSALEWVMGKCQRFYFVVLTKVVVFFHQQLSGNPSNSLKLGVVPLLIFAQT